MRNSIGAVIVTYHPDIRSLHQLLERIQHQVKTIVLVDNTPGVTQPWHALLKLEFNINLIIKTRNFGIAAAQNDGIRHLLQQECEFVLFLDQDSLPSSVMVFKLYVAYRELTKNNLQIAGVGPRSLIPKLGQDIPFMKLGFFGYERCYCGLNSQIISVTHLISSGTLAPLSVFEQIGLMREDLFIDYVDIEWCLRAQNRGYKLFGICAAEMQHDLGDEPLLIMGQSFLTHSPLRHYYLVRNAITLYKDSQIKLIWKISDAFRVFAKVIFYCLFCHPRWQHVKMICYGFKDGIQNRLGEAPVFIKP